jgi:hypothetical protein
MNIKPLLDITCLTVANMIKGAQSCWRLHATHPSLRGIRARAGKTPAEIRDAFGIKNDFSPDEEEEVRRGTYMPLPQRAVSFSLISRGGYRKRVGVCLKLAQRT